MYYTFQYTETNALNNFFYPIFEYFKAPECKRILLLKFSGVLSKLNYVVRNIHILAPKILEILSPCVARSKSDKF